ncbi:chromosome partitioning protein [Pseudoduganella lurida]|uniref:Chromosome partitioning protein n=1 Tax=Pseudoduganella lurida TaxID=1036180 RepID=A0A562RB33_9BURK|nr:cobyrinic acid ac-diamide synthase [Pseudoduganella lurida]TWI66281.1 chromosome partitioning protein [Pseudoduganella lurida]
MIVTIVSEGSCNAKLALAERLAAHRSLSGRKVLLVDADSEPHPHPPLPVAAKCVNGKSVGAELENLGMRFQDIVVDADGRDSLGSRAALIAARVVVVPADAVHNDPARAIRLADRIANARLFNPGLRIVIVPCDQPCGTDAACATTILQRTLPGAELSASGEALFASVFRN